ncbi:hypothetical protein H4S04_000610 [Coemansia sp. S16]|nr:hypothetical protein H4S04_000610 [Coemansia sp. S16]
MVPDYAMKIPVNNGTIEGVEVLEGYTNELAIYGDDAEAHLQPIISMLAGLMGFGQSPTTTATSGPPDYMGGRPNFLPQETVALMSIQTTTIVRRDNYIDDHIDSFCDDHIDSLCDDHVDNLIDYFTNNCSDINTYGYDHDYSYSYSYCYFLFSANSGCAANNGIYYTATSDPECTHDYYQHCDEQWYDYNVCNHYSQ